MKRIEKLYKNMPAGYPLCLHANCTKAETCLHQLVYQCHEELGTYLKIINPLQCTCKDDCPFYASNQPVRFAKGFTQFREKMYPSQYNKFMALLICHYGRNRYYRLRNGVFLLSLNDQKVIEAALKKSGVGTKMEFDAYVEALNWER